MKMWVLGGMENSNNHTHYSILLYTIINNVWLHCTANSTIALV